MKYLLDVNVLIAGIVETHSKHVKTENWLQGKEIVVCPISQLGFLRIASHPKAIGLTMERAREALNTFILDSKADLISDDFPAWTVVPERQMKLLIIIWQTWQRSMVSNWQRWMNS